MAEKGASSDKALSVSSNTLFVRNLPYSSRDADLEAAYAEYGSLKSCFTVKDKGVADKCRGFGYVTFATREEAERAKSAVKVIGRRPVQVSFANRKLSWKQRKQKQPPTAAASGVEPGQSRSDEDTRSSEEAESDDDYEAMTARKADEAPQHRHKRKPRTQRGDPKFDIGRVLVLSGLPEAMAMEKIRKKCGKFGTVTDVIFPVPDRETPTAFVTYQTHKEARQAAVGLEGKGYKGSALRAVVLSKEGKAVSKKTLKKSNLIVRNLSFQCSESDVREVFSPFGEVAEVRIPRKPDGRMLGYAFVQFVSYYSAASALATVNGREIRGRTVAVDWVVPRDKYQQSLREQPMEGGQTTEPQGAATAEEEDLSEEEGVEQGEESESKDGGPEIEEREASMSEEEGSVGGGGEEVGGSAGSESEAGSLEEEQEEKKPFKEDVHEGKTLFIRGVPFDGDEDELGDVLAQFGALRYCRLVTNSATGMCRGSAFVQYFSPSSVRACLEASSTENSKGIHYGGRRLDITMAMSKQEVKQFQEQKQPKKEVDKRNLYLSKEGAILPDSEVARDLSKADMAKRMKALTEKKSKLANPNFFVSKTRLSIRNLPTQVSEKQLKELFLKSAGGPPARVKQVKIMRSSERVDSSGIGRSKGFAFVDFTAHEPALAALRATNNNPGLFGLKKRLIVEFAVEDSRALKLREQRKRQRIAKKTTTSSSSSSSAKKVENGESEPKVPSVRTKWKLKCKAKRLRRRDRKKEEPSQPSKIPAVAVKETSQLRPIGINGGKGTPSATQIQVGTKRKHISRPNEKARNFTAMKKFKSERTELTAQKSDLASESKSSVLRLSEDTLLASKRTVKLQREDRREEENFTRMVDSYKRKLFGNVSDSRWFE